MTDVMERARQDYSSLTSLDLADPICAAKYKQHESVFVRAGCKIKSSLEGLVVDVLENLFSVGETLKDASLEGQEQLLELGQALQAAPEAFSESASKTGRALRRDLRQLANFFRPRTLAERFMDSLEETHYSLQELAKSATEAINRLLGRNTKV